MTTWGQLSSQGRRFGADPVSVSTCGRRQVAWEVRTTP